MSIIPITNYETNLNSTIAPPIDLGSLFIPVVSGSNYGLFNTNAKFTNNTISTINAMSPDFVYQFSSSLFTNNVPTVPTTGLILVSVTVYLGNNGDQVTSTFTLGITNSNELVGTTPPNTIYLTQTVVANNNNGYNFRSITLSGIIPFTQYMGINSNNPSFYLIANITGVPSSETITITITNGYWVYLGPG